MNPYPQDKSILILDNCAIHKTRTRFEKLLRDSVASFFSCHHTLRISIQLKRASAAVRLSIFANNYSCPFCSETLDSDKLVQGSSCQISRDCIAGVVSSCYIGEGQGLVHSLWVQCRLVVRLFVCCKHHVVCSGVSCCSHAVLFSRCTVLTLYCSCVVLFLCCTVPMLSHAIQKLVQCKH
jgi:hypothetical protein